MVIIKELSSGEYAKLPLNPHVAFDTHAFNELNASKCLGVRYFVAQEEGKDKFGIIGGMSADGVFRLPFSAPFGLVSSVKKHNGIRSWHESISAFVLFLRSEGRCTGMQVTPPPAIYAPDTIAVIENALMQNGFSVDTIDLNYHFDLSNFDEVAYEDKIDIKARQKLRAALKANLEFHVATSERERDIAYEVIKRNREARGYPLRLSADDMKKTSGCIDIEYSYVTLDGAPIASAVVYAVTEDIMQVVYWGNMPDSEEYKPMNFLAFALFRHYRQQGKRQIDIGISTEHGAPNFGLCEFKTSIGCIATIKPTFALHFAAK